MQIDSIADVGVCAIEQKAKRPAPPIIPDQVCVICGNIFSAQGRRNACSKKCVSFLGKNTDEQWLFNKAEKVGDCWNWFGACDNGGHPVSYRAGERGIAVTRIARKIFGYPEYSGRLVRGCESEKCVNPAHWLNDEERFEDKLMPLIDGCVMWVGATDEDGYGLGRLDGVFGRMTRLLWEREYGLIESSKLFCCHHCDRPWCVNVDHLFLGTAKDNMEDCVSKRRNNRRLSEESVELARAQHANNGRSIIQMAEELGVHEMTLRAAVNGRTWLHVK